MTYALCGAQRTGKTTLAKAFSERTGTPLLLTDASGVFAELGISPKAHLDFELRFEIQKRILEEFARQYRLMGGPFITDRTPVDLMAYLMADVQRSNIKSYMEGRIETYLRECVDVCNSTFSMLMVVAPGIAPVEEPNKAPASFAYTEHIHRLVMGIAVSEEIYTAHFCIPRFMTDLNQRVDAVLYAIRRSQEKFNDRRKHMERDGYVLTVH